MRADLESVQVVLLAGGGATTLESRLVELGCEVLGIADNAQGAEHALRSERPEALVFEAGAEGEGFLERARRADPSCACIAWLPSASSAAVADLLVQGADEVVHEGMGQRELGARIAAAARRSGARVGGTLELGSLRIDVVNGEVEWAGQDLALTRREREVLQALADSAGRTLPREILYKRVWGYAMARGDRSVDVNVKRLRAKLGKLTESTLVIKTQPGVGYRLELAEDREPAEQPVTAS